MKKIINRRTGKHIEDPYEARVLIRDVKKVYPFVQSDEHLSLPEDFEARFPNYVVVGG